MILDKALLVKGLVGAASVAGLGGIVVFRKELGIVKDSKPETQRAKTKPNANAKQVSSSGREADNQGADGSTGSQAPGVTEGQNAASDGVQPGAAGGGTPGSVEPSPTGVTVETEEQKKAKKKTSVNEQLTTLGLDSCHLDDSNLTSSTIFSKECTLDQAKFKKINFSNKGENDVTVDGWSGTNTVTLKIENKDPDKIKYTFKDVNSKLTIVGATGKGVITLPQSSEREFEEKEGKLSKVSLNSSGATKLKELNKKLESIKIPERCWFDEAENDETIECDLSKQEELKKIEFLNKEWGKESKISGSTSSLKMTINKLSAEEAKLKSAYSTTDLEFIFKNYSSEIRIQDNRTDSSVATGDIILVPNTNPILTISSDTSSQNRLSKEFIISNFSEKLGFSCTNSNVACTPINSETKIKILTNNDTEIEEITVQSSQENEEIMCVAENADGYEQGIKFTPKASFLTTSSKLEANAHYQAKYVKNKGWGLSKKN